MPLRKKSVVSVLRYGERFEAVYRVMVRVKGGEESRWFVLSRVSCLEMPNIRRPSLLPASGDAMTTRASAIKLRPLKPRHHQHAFTPLVRWSVSCLVLLYSRRLTSHDIATYEISNVAFLTGDLHSKMSARQCSRPCPQVWGAWKLSQTPS